MKKIVAILLLIGFILTPLLSEAKVILVTTRDKDGKVLFITEKETASTTKKAEKIKEKITALKKESGYAQKTPVGKKPFGVASLICGLGGASLGFGIVAPRKDYIAVTGTVLSIIGIYSDPDPAWLKALAFAGGIIVGYKSGMRYYEKYEENRNRHYRRRFYRYFNIVSTNFKF